MGTYSWMPPEVFIHLALKKKRRPKYSFEFDVWMIGLLVLDARLSGRLHKMKGYEPVSVD